MSSASASESKSPDCDGMFTSISTGGFGSSEVSILTYNKEGNFTLHKALMEFAPFKMESFSVEIHEGEYKNFLAISGKLVYLLTVKKDEDGMRWEDEFL